MLLEGIKAGHEFAKFGKMGPRVTTVEYRPPILSLTMTAKEHTISIHYCIDPGKIVT